MLPERERITVDLDVTSLIVEGVRRLPPVGPIRARCGDPQLVLEMGEAAPDGLLLAWEEHVLTLVDGERTAFEICHESEAGEGQTQKLLYALLSTGIVRSCGRKVRALDQDFVPADSMFAVLDSFNRMYCLVCATMVREVGPIAENVLAKYLKTVREAHPQVLADVGLRKDGSIDDARRGAQSGAPARGPPARGPGRRPQRAVVRGAARGQAHARPATTRAASCASCGPPVERAHAAAGARRRTAAWRPCCCWSCGG